MTRTSVIGLCVLGVVLAAGCSKEPTPPRAPTPTKARAPTKALPQSASELSARTVQSQADQIAQLKAENAKLTGQIKQLAQLKAENTKLAGQIKELKDLCTKAGITPPGATPATAPAMALPKSALKFSITEGVFAETDAGSGYDHKEIRIQSENDQPVTVLAVAWNRQKEVTRVYYTGGRQSAPGYKQCPCSLAFGDTVYVGLDEISEPVIEVLIRTNRGDFTTRNIKHESTQRLRPNAPEFKSYPPGSF